MRQQHSMMRITTRDENSPPSDDPTLSAINAWAQRQYGTNADDCTLRDINAWAHGRSVRSLADMNHRAGDHRPGGVVRTLADINRWATRRWSRAR